MGSDRGESLSPFLVYVLGEPTGGGAGLHPLGSGATKAVEHAARRGVDWLIWRIVTHERIPDGLVELRDRWTLGDLLTAHLALDAIEEIEEIGRKSKR